MEGLNLSYLVKGRTRGEVTGQGRLRQLCRALGKGANTAAWQHPGAGKAGRQGDGHRARPDHGNVFRI